MSLPKSTVSQNFTSLDKVQIIKDIYVTDLPDALSIYLSEMSFAGERQFEDIEITDGNFSITDDDEGHGTIYKVQADFRHPKVREEAENFLQPYRGKLVRLVLTDKNGTNRLTPAGKLSIKENVPEMPNYNGYLIQFYGEGELVPYITMDAYPVPPESLWDQIYYSAANAIALVNQPFTLNLSFKNYLGVERLLMINFNDILEIIPFNASERKEITRQYAAAEGSFIKISGATDNGDGTYSESFFGFLWHDDMFEMKDAGATRFFSVADGYWFGKLDISGNSIIKEDMNVLLEKYEQILTQPNYWDPYPDNYFFIDGVSPYGYNGIPDSELALQIKAAMIGIDPLSYRDNT